MYAAECELRVKKSKWRKFGEARQPRGYRVGSRASGELSVRQ